MNETCRLLGRWKVHHGLTTDAAAARKLGISRGAVSHWRTRGSHADAATIVRMCDDLGEDLAACLMRIAKETTHARTSTRGPVRAAAFLAAGGSRH